MSLNLNEVEEQMIEALLISKRAKWLTIAENTSGELSDQYYKQVRTANKLLSQIRAQRSVREFNHA